VPSVRVRFSVPVQRLFFIGKYLYPTVPPVFRLIGLTFRETYAVKPFDYGLRKRPAYRSPFGRRKLFGKRFSPPSSLRSARHDIESGHAFPNNYYSSAVHVCRNRVSSTPTYAQRPVLQRAIFFELKQPCVGVNRDRLRNSKRPTRVEGRGERCRLRFGAGRYGKHEPCSSFFARGRYRGFVRNGFSAKTRAIRTNSFRDHFST